MTAPDDESAKLYDLVVNSEGGTTFNRRREFEPERVVLDYPHFIIDLAQFEHRLMAPKSERIGWLYVRNALIESITLKENNVNDGMLQERKWKALVDLISEKNPGFASMYAHSDLYSKHPVKGLAEAMTRALGLDEESMLAHSIYDACGVVTGEINERGITHGIEQTPRGAAADMEVPETGPALARSREARLRTPLSETPPGEESENPYARAFRLGQEIRDDIPSSRNRS